MKLLEERILKDGKVYPGGIVKVDSFLNHQIDITLLSSLAKEFARLFGQEHVTKVLTVEASGIAIATLTAQELGCPLVFAKKSKTKNLDGNLYHASAHSYTHGDDNDLVVCRDYLQKNDRVLMIDDFLATGEAFRAMAQICRQAECTIVGCGAVIEKVCQGGGKSLCEMGIRVESLARIASLDKKDGIKFC